MPYMCPVCGYPNLQYPPYSPQSGASYEICPSCGFQFGYDDEDQSITFAQWRQGWIERGMPWYSSGIAPPINWDPSVQLMEAKRDDTLRDG